MNDDQLLTTAEAIAYLHVTKRTMYRLLKRGEIPAFRVGRQWRFRKRDLDRWLRDNRRANRQESDRARVLVVDDDPAVTRYIAEALSKGDYDVDAVDSGRGALERLHDADYDLMFTDLKMPGMDGLSMIREARRHAHDLPIVIITGASTEASAIEAINLGVVGYLLKPFNPQKVLAAAAKALGDPIEVGT